MPLRLKSLELHGFKTFANRTAFEFAETVTAIVGPNGSGKSNIADSLRWVLGEQSYSLLRAKKTEDMIFSGSESRPRAGMAASTITFDNTDNWLPIDFSEVAITRRAYRDGNNEYLINGQRVRLKDVSELLAQSGLAERTYTIIGQGLVDAALSLRADERRRLFEEAAGIGLHRSRREEALRRLESTRRNLERVEDILAELKPRLASLERQARRALEYEQVRSDLQVMLREWYGFHWHAAQQELAEARQAVQTQEARLGNERRLQDEIDQKLGVLREQLSARRSELNGWRRSLAELHSRREMVVRELAVAEEREHSIDAQQENAHQELQRMADELEFHCEAVQAAEVEVQRLTGDLDDARKEMDATRSALSKRQAERAGVERQVQAVRQEIGGLNSRQGQGQARYSESQAQVRRWHEALESAGQAQAKAEAARKQAEEQESARRNALQEADARLKDAEAVERNLREQIASVETERRQAQEICAGQAAELARLRAQIGVLEQAEAALSGYATGARRLLQAACQARLSGARGALSSHLETPAELERAVTAALGEFLDAVILEGDPEQALDLLKDDQGRGLVLPLANLSPVSRLQVKVDDDILGIAAGLVQTTDDLRPAVDLMLGQVIVVRDRPSARRALIGQPIGARAVTLLGEVFYASGPVQGGSSGGESGETLLGRGRKLRQFTSESQALEVEITASDSRVGTLDRNLAELQAERDRLSQEHDRLRQAQRAATQAAESARLTLEAAGRQERWALDQRKHQQEDLQRSQQETRRLEQELAELEKRLVEARASLRAHTSQLEALSLDELQTQAAHWTTRMAVAERALGDARNRLGERQAAIERLRQSQEAIQSRRSALEAQRLELGEQRKLQRSQSETYDEEIWAFTARIEPAEAELTILEADAELMQKNETAARGSVGMAEHFNAQARITLARRQESLSSLQRRIEEDFGLVAFEYDDQVSGQSPLPLDGMVEKLPVVKKLPPEIEENLKRQRAQLRRMGAINPDAQAEYEEVRQRYEFLTSQVVDLNYAEQDIRQVVAELDEIMQREFRRTFEAVAIEFREIFTRLFGGGSARLVLTDPNDLTGSGIDIEARLPGRRMQGLALLSGGERSLTAVSLVFALLRVSPTPFCVLDEVDAMLDEANVGRFRDLLRELSRRTQFIIVTHNRNTVQVADVIYGVTMGRDSASQVLSLKLDDVDKVVDIKQ